MSSPLLHTELNEGERHEELPDSVSFFDPVSPHRLQKLPILILNVHERCNCKCLMCDIWKRESNGELSPGDLARLQNSIIKLGVHQVVLTGGEPLLHSDLSAICTLLRECDVRITLLSTGLLLKKRAELVASSVDEVIISLDGPEEIHDKVRRVRGGFQLIREGIRAVRQLKPDMRIGGRCTVQRANHTALRQTVVAARMLGLNSISFLASDVTSQAFNRDLVWPVERQNEIALSSKEVVALDTEIDLLISEHREDIVSKYIVESAEKLHRISRHFRANLAQVPPVAPLCNAPWVSAVVEIDGSVRPCFFHPKVGDLKTATLEGAINSIEAQSFRSTLNIAENSVCQRCVCSLRYRDNSAKG